MFQLTIVTPQKKLIGAQEIEEVFVPANRGELNILPGHAALITTLSPGILRYRLKGSSDLNYVAISWGYCEVANDTVSVLAETAETAEDLDHQKVHIELKDSLHQLAAPDLDEEVMETARRNYERAVARQELLGLHRGNNTTH